MKETRIIMGMPVTVEIAANGATHTSDQDVAGAINAAFDYFSYVDKKFSTYKPDSEIMRINRGELSEEEWSDDMRIIFMLAEETKQRTNGFFDIRRPGHTLFYDPSGIVKGWAIWNASRILKDFGFEHFYVDAGGDIQTSGSNEQRKPWTVGIKNPFKQDEVVKTIVAKPSGTGIATSGTYIRGEHIYDPKSGAAANAIASLTVVGANVYEADRFATAAFAMGPAGIHFIESLPGLEGYMIDSNGVATMTNGFER